MEDGELQPVLWLVGPEKDRPRRVDNPSVIFWVSSGLYSFVGFAYSPALIRSECRPTSVAAHGNKNIL